MTIRLVELGDDRHGLIRAVIPAQGPTGLRQIGYALPLHNKRGEYLVRVAGRGLAFTAGNRKDAEACLLAAPL